MKKYKKKNIFVVFIKFTIIKLNKMWNSALLYNYSKKRDIAYVNG